MTMHVVHCFLDDYIATNPLRTLTFTFHEYLLAIWHMEAHLVKCGNGAKKRWEIEGREWDIFLVLRLTPMFGPSMPPSWTCWKNFIAFGQIPKDLKMCTRGPISGFDNYEGLTPKWFFLTYVADLRYTYTRQHLECHGVFRIAIQQKCAQCPPSQPWLMSTCNVSGKL